MKSISIITTQEKTVDPKSGLDYDFEITTLTLIRTAVNNTPAGGFNVTDMMDRLKIGAKFDELQKKIDEAKKLRKENAKKIKDGSDETNTEKIPIEAPIILDLEDALFVKLGGYVKSMSWGFISQTIVDFTNLFKDE